jgi:hypothetical protein
MERLAIAGNYLGNNPQNSLELDFSLGYLIKGTK